MSANKGLNIAKNVFNKWNGETAGLTSLNTTTTSKTHNDWNAAPVAGMVMHDFL